MIDSHFVFIFRAEINGKFLISMGGTQKVLIFDDFDATSTMSTSAFLQKSKLNQSDSYCKAENCLLCLKSFLICRSYFWTESLKTRRKINCKAENQIDRFLFLHWHYEVAISFCSFLRHSPFVISTC